MNVEAAFNIRVGANAVIIDAGKVLLIAFQDELSGFHYNFPGGGVRAGETAREALEREALEETCAAIEVGQLLLVTEYEPNRNFARYGTLHKLNLFFACKLKIDCIPRLPENPDPNQVGVHWVALDDLQNVMLLPSVAAEILEVYQKSVGADTYLSIG